MPWERCIGLEPPTAEVMNRWEAEGWQRIQVIAAPATHSQTGESAGAVYVVWLWRPRGGTYKRPAFPVRLAPRALGPLDDA